jgi:hypothetical protein
MRERMIYALAGMSTMNMPIVTVLQKVIFCEFMHSGSRHESHYSCILAQIQHTGKWYDLGQMFGGLP